MRKKLLIIILLSSLLSCECEIPDEEFTMQRKPCTTKQIRMDGYYEGAINAQKEFFEYLFFNENGVYYRFSYEDHESMDKIVNNIAYSQKNKQNWGIFQITDTLINVQMWTQKSGTIQNIIYSFQYLIINDTSLLGSFNGQSSTYHFKKFSPKPDSTNVFIK